MNTKYLLLPRLEVQRANAVATAGVISVCPVLPAVLMGEHFGFCNNLKPTGVLLIHHDSYLLADVDLDYSKNHKEYYPHQFRGATVFNTKDIAGGGTSIPSNSIQPTASMNGTWSVVFRFDDCASSAESLAHKGNTFVNQNARLAGGVIHASQKPRVFGDINDLTYHIKSGFITVDRSSWIASDTLSRMECLWQMAGQKKVPSSSEKKRWLIPSSLGYALISSIEDRPGAREGKQHAYAETMLGLVEMISIRESVTDSPESEKETLKLDECFWKYSWINDDVFLITQS